MRDKLKLYVPIIILALLFYMMITTPHSRALGDILLEVIGLKAWTDGHDGMHLTVIYFGTLFLIILLRSNSSSAMKPNNKRKHKIIIFICTVITIYLVHSALIQNMMGNSVGLNSIAIAPSGNTYEYKIVEGEIEEFKFEFKLTNYSEEVKQFSIVGFNDNIAGIEMYNKQREIVQFEIHGKETRIYKIDLGNYIIEVKGIGKIKNYASRGIINSLLLLNDNGNETEIVKLRDMGIDK
ncbi:hypothetical protein I5677_16900 [Mobilitalea sibirica]|uniref:Uncharacterized protein n=1 Tax=Mobilitalea sibirica TaxID=1462919 RepID=A0A8J7L0J9_9FIRM|nr:hypothetical protein [Mobilitalea sibirica]MBH1942573.1 hypothetical protein [Mobilitalea sibirica]